MNEVFMCWVEGGHVPRRRHASLDDAKIEAKRLASLPTCKGRVFVLTDVDVFEKEAVLPKVPVITLKKKRLTVITD